VNDFLTTVEKHKDLADIGLKAIGLLGGLIAAVIVAIKYLAEKRAARKTKELDLRRDAYYSFFAAIPLQLAALANFFKPNRDPLVLPSEYQVALHKLHLLANRDALKIIIERNALFHKAVMDLAEIKNTALNHQELRSNLLNDILASGAKIFSQEGAAKDVAVHQQAAAKERFAKLEPYRILAWENFITKYQGIGADLSRNYLFLLPYARAEIGLNKKIDDIIATMESDREAALTEFEAKMDSIRTGFGLEPRSISSGR
jgi:ribosomal protein S28E/S33